MSNKITDVKTNEKNEVLFTYDAKNYILIESEYLKVVTQPKKTVYCLNGPSRVDLVKFGMPIQKVEGYSDLCSVLKNIIPAEALL
ncbi:hypothetical protein [Sulfurimonas sp. HSL3-7]|uniref:hypothetical protein n=1 Tax=Sulfonitrofixus jiaomeiensis TaxID=3131938 RepID=UPI0031F8A459